MKTFKEFFTNTKEPVSWLNWNGDFASIRKEPLKEEELTPNVRWNTWTGSRMKHSNATKNNKNAFYEKIHDDPQVVPNDTDDVVPPINHYCRTPSNDRYGGHASSSNVNNHLRHLAGQKVSEGGEHTQGIVGGHSPEKVQQAIRDLSATFKGNTNRKPVKVYAGIPKHIGEKIQSSDKGTVHRNPGFLSTSTEEGQALDYASQYAEKDDTDTHHVVQLHLHPGSGRSVAHHSNFEENEVLVHHGAKMVYSHTEDHETPSGHPLKVHHLEVFPDHEPMEKYPNFAKK